ncbi:MAG: FAD-dependent oxidoreductase [Rhodobacteraceae bacterium]|nr:FAD-dependent oxidoreductase [Paracoccaceae bacterium]
MSAMFPLLFSPFELKGLEIKNRVFSTGHDTDLCRSGLPTDELIAYQVARAKGGAGLIVIQVVAVHPSALYTSEALQGWHSQIVPEFKRLVDAIKVHGTRVFVQLFHPGRELASRMNGVVKTAWGVSSVPSERFRVVPKTMSTMQIEEVIQAYVDTGMNLVEAGVDGLEIVGSHGYLPAQFLSPVVNTRNDRFGGSYDNRLRFVQEISAKLRAQVPSNIIVGARFSGIEFDEAGMNDDAMFDVCRDLAPSLDYLNVIGGTSASNSGSIHIAPPMTIENAYMSAFSGKLKQALPDTAVFVAGRINQPHEAEAVLKAGGADMCGMTRAMICDPQMPSKARANKPDDIRACIACNQACIGHAQLGLPISCIQHPESGRELTFGTLPEINRAQNILVVGGGPGGMKAAAVAARMGHNVVLAEQSSQLGGQVKLAQLLPNRAEFGGLITNLSRELTQSGAKVQLNLTVTRGFIEEGQFDHVIVATGSTIELPVFENDGEMTVLSHEQVLTGSKTGTNVVVFDWRSDWVGIGLVEHLVAQGCRVRMAVNGICAGAAIQSYVRDAAIARLNVAEVEVTPFARLYGVDEDTVYCMHTASQQPIVFEGVDTLVIASAMMPSRILQDELDAADIAYSEIGDAASPRTAEETIFEGLQAAISLTGSQPS